jgi:hypothetical protein
MRASVISVFLGVGTFALGLLYFYVLVLSIVVTISGLLSWWFVAAGWVLLFAVLYGEKYVKQKTGLSIAFLLMG